MKFLKILGITLVLSYLFVFFGGWMLFEFSKHVYLTTTVLALIAAAIIYAFMEQDKRIEQLEKRVKELEDKPDTQ